MNDPKIVVDLQETIWKSLNHRTDKQISLKRKIESIGTFSRLTFLGHDSLRLGYDAPGINFHLPWWYRVSNRQNSRSQLILFRFWMQMNSNLVVFPRKSTHLAMWFCRQIQDGGGVTLS